MKKLLLFVSVILLSVGLQAQDKEIVKESFYPNGNLKSQFVKVNAELIEATYYFESGVVYETGFFQEDALTGEWKTYNVNAELLAVGYFSEGKKAGTWKIYQEGELFREISYSEVQMAKN